MEHRCKGMEALKSDAYGTAFDRIFYDDEDSAWLIGNGEYYSYPIYYCPCCGVNLPGRVNKITNG